MRDTIPAMIDQPRARGASEPPRDRSLALVLWNGDVGGAEVLNLELADRLRRLGTHVTILFIGTPWPLAERFEQAGIPYLGLELGRGRKVLLHARRYAAEAARVGADGALLMERGLMAAVLRAGGYRAPIVAVEHGALLAERHDRTLPHRVLRELGRAAGAWADDTEVAVSDFMLEQMRRRAHARASRRIYNGIDPDLYCQAPNPDPGSTGQVLIGFAGRLIAGKGAKCLIEAMRLAGMGDAATLSIAGDGPERSFLEQEASRLGVASQVCFLGVVEDMVAFWQRCDIAAIPSQVQESFSMVTLEAMSCGKAIVASRRGAIPELVLDGQTGTLVECEDAEALARALKAYAGQPDLRRAHGLAARTRAIERFHIQDCARGYVELFDDLAR
jgi:glycosyltransferase involved in cell wall biosynthesis